MPVKMPAAVLLAGDDGRDQVEVRGVGQLDHLLQLRRLMPGAPAEDQDDEIARGLYPSGGRSGTWTDPECPQPACADLPAAQLAQPGRCGGPR
eukprot:COSAG06_NODE_57_length_27525_cov_14.855279_26_plen_93_part_00